MRFRLGSAAIVACLALTLATCGGEQQEAPTPATGAGPSPSVEAASPDDVSLVTIAEILRTDTRFSRFAEIAERAETTYGGVPMNWLRMWDIDKIGYQGEGVTIFVPTNDAFEALPPAIAAIIDDPDVEQRHLRTLIGAHYLPHPYPAEAFEPGPHPVHRGESEPVELALEPLSWGGQLIEEADVRAINGHIHILGGVVVPEVVAGAAND